MKKFLQTFTIALAALGIVGTLALAPTAGALNITKQGSQDTSTLKNSGGDNFTTIMTRVISTMMFVLGLVAVVIIVIGGFKFVTANGDPNAIKSARNTILYACVGLVIAILAYSIVNFVLGAFTSS